MPVALFRKGLIAHGAVIDLFERESLFSELTWDLSQCSNMATERRDQPARNKKFIEL